MLEKYSTTGRAERKAELIQGLNVILPVGGLATRALEITEDKIPKHLIRLKTGQTVLDRILHGLQREGYKNFIFCTGHHSEVINSYISAGNTKNYAKGFFWRGAFQLRWNRRRGLVSTSVAIC